MAAEQYESDGEGELQSPRAAQRAAHRTEVLNLRMSGMTLQQIADHFKISYQAVQHTINDALMSGDKEKIEAYRALENARLDRLQLAIWRDAIAGDHKAIGTYLRISERRARINGLDAPTKLDVSMNVRHEMESALDSLEQLVFSQTIKGEVVDEPAALPAAPAPQPTLLTPDGADENSLRPPLEATLAGSEHEGQPATRPAVYPTTDRRATAGELVPEEEESFVVDEDLHPMARAEEWWR